MKSTTIPSGHSECPEFGTTILSPEEVNIGRIAGVLFGATLVGIITSPEGCLLLKTVTGPPSLCSKGRLLVEVSGYGGSGVTFADPSSVQGWSGLTSAS